MKKFYVLLALIATVMTANADTFGTRMYLLGDATPSGWDLNNMTLMETIEVGKYQWIGELKEGYMRFKVNCTSNDWKNCYGPVANGDEFVGGEMHFFSGDTDGEAPSYKLNASGFYKLEIDLTGAAPQLTISDGTGLTATNVTAQNPHYIYAIGSATGFDWSLDASKVQPLKETAFDSGVYTGVVPFKGDGEMKFLCQADWGNHYGPATEGEALDAKGEYDVTLHADGDYKFNVSSLTGDLYVTINLATGKMNISSEATGIKAVESATTISKRVENGKVVIIRNGVRYNVAGIRL